MLFSRRKPDDTVSMDGVARILEAARGLFEAGLKAGRPDIGPQVALTPREAEDVLKRMQDTRAAALRKWVETGEAPSGPAS